MEGHGPWAVSLQQMHAKTRHGLDLASSLILFPEALVKLGNPANLFSSSVTVVCRNNSPGPDKKAASLQN